MTGDNLKAYPRILDCHPEEVESLRRTMFVQGYLSAKKIGRLVGKVDPKELQKELARLQEEAHREFDAFTKAMEQLHEQMLKAADAKKEAP